MFQSEKTEDESESTKRRQQEQHQQLKIETARGKSEMSEKNKPMACTHMECIC